MPDKLESGRRAAQTNEELRGSHDSADGPGEASEYEFERMRAIQGAGVTISTRGMAKDQKSSDGKVEHEMEELKRQRAEDEEDQA